MVRSGKRPDPQLGFRIRPQPATAFPSVVIRLGPRLFWEECVVATTTIDGEFAVVCATCGNELDVTVEEKALPRRRSAVVTVEPCETCLGRRYEDGLADQRDMLTVLEQGEHLRRRDEILTAMVAGAGVRGHERHPAPAD